MEELNQDFYPKFNNQDSFSNKKSKGWMSRLDLRLKKILSNLSIVESFIFYLFVVLFAFSGLFMFFELNGALMAEVPAKRGFFSEGVIGYPRAINPLLAGDSSETDKDLVLLVYSGLLKATPEGDLIPDLAESYNISKNGLTYNFKLKDDIYFHDGEEIKAEDVKFTIEKAQDPLIKSSERINWDGVKVKILNDKELDFILPQAYAPFLENTTLGILPKHLWENLDAEQFALSPLNLKPIGSGPYEIESIKRNGDGLPVYYSLGSFKKNTLGQPNIKDIYFKFYQNEEGLISAFQNEEIENVNSISPGRALSLKMDGFEIKRATLSRIFGVFFNQNQAPIFVNKEVRKALEMAIDREGLINQVLAGYGKPIGNPVKIQSKVLNETEENRPAEEKLSAAKLILEEGGWKFDEDKKIWTKKVKAEELELSFSISTADTPDFKAAAQIIKDDWESLGAKVDIKIFDLSDLKQNIIRPRKYEALLFGTVIGRDMDLYPFWHSSQRNDPGLNIALYVNSQADKVLEEIRHTTDKTLRTQKYAEFGKMIEADTPAIFIYSPEFIYLVPNRIKNIKLDFLTASSERFLNIEDWYVETDKVWKIFTK